MAGNDKSSATMSVLKVLVLMLRRVLQGRSCPAQNEELNEERFGVLVETEICSSAPHLVLCNTDGS